MLVIHVKLAVKADQTTEFLDAVAPFVKQARGLDGCLDYTWYQSTEHDNTYILYELWESESQFRDYKASELFTSTQQALLPFAAGKPESNYYTADVLEAF